MAHTLSGVSVPPPSSSNMSSSNIGESRFLWRGYPPGGCGSARCPTLNEPCLSGTGVASSLAPDHCGLEANILRFDDPLQAARRCSTFPTDE